MGGERVPVCTLLRGAKPRTCWAGTYIDVLGVRVVSLNRAMRNPQRSTDLKVEYAARESAISNGTTGILLDDQANPFWYMDHSCVFVVKVNPDTGITNDDVATIFDVIPPQGTGKVYLDFDNTMYPEIKRDVVQDIAAACFSCWEDLQCSCYRCGFRFHENIKERK